MESYHTSICTGHLAGAAVHHEPHEEERRGDGTDQRLEVCRHGRGPVLPHNLHGVHHHRHGGRAAVGTAHNRPVMFALPGSQSGPTSVFLPLIFPRSMCGREAPRLRPCWPSCQVAGVCGHCIASTVNLLNFQTMGRFTSLPQTGFDRPKSESL